MSFVLILNQWPVFIIYPEIYSMTGATHIRTHAVLENVFMNNTLYPINTGEFTTSIFETLYAIS